MKNISKEQYAEIDRLFGSGTAAHLESKRNNEPGADLASRLKEMRKNLEVLKSNFREQFGSPEKLQPMLSPRAALFQRQTKEAPPAPPAISPNSVQRVEAVLVIADRLMLNRDAVQKLIRQLGFDEVEAVLNVLAGEKSMKQLKSSEGWPVNYIDIGDVETMALRHKQSKVTKEHGSLKAFLGEKFVK